MVSSVQPIRALILLSQSILSSVRVSLTSHVIPAVERAMNIANQADVIAALSLEVLKGTSRAYDPGEILTLLFFL